MFNYNVFLLLIQRVRGEIFMTKPVYAKYIVKVDVDCNNNKFWSCKVYDDGTFIREWGRVGGSKREQTNKYSDESVAMREALKIKRSKERDGYKEIELLSDNDGFNKKRLDNKSVMDIAIKELAKGKGVAVKSLIARIANENIHNIIKNTNLSYNEDTGLFSSALGVVSMDSILKAEFELNIIESCVKKKDFGTQKVKVAVSNYLTFIPQSVGSKLDIKFLFGSNDKILKQRTILSDLKDSVNFVENKKDSKINNKNEKIKHFNTHIELVKDKKIISYVKEKYERGKMNNHASSKLKVKRVFDVKLEGMLKNYETQKSKMKNERKLWHGSRTGNILSILKDGMHIPKRTAGHVTGRMFGDGLYFSDQSTKALNYSYGFWSGKRDANCYAFICNVLLGESYTPKNYDINMHKKGYDSVFAKGGYSGVMNNEFIVYKTEQVSPRWLVEFE